MQMTVFVEETSIVFFSFQAVLQITCNLMKAMCVCIHKQLVTA